MGIAEAFKRWREFMQSSRKGDHNGRLQKNIDTIAALKDKIAEIEHDNNVLSNENEELR